ncbi:sterol desaturase [Duganella rhizosphaerae]|uniref:sterol desaturase family protein n=1 Tax=Duganella rhizosphaerae TaxID=2885763 RepID=UPI0030E9E7D4
MNPIVFAIPVFMLTILLEAWIAHRRGLAAYDTADALTSLHLGMVSQVVGLFVKLAMLGIYTAVYEHWRFVSLPANSVWVWLGALLAYDFCYYWTHRLGHEVGVMWAAHVVHHSSEFYNLSTALRQTSSGWVLGWLFYLPMALAGVPPLVLVGVGLIDLLYQYWVHTEMVGRLGLLDRVFVTPSNHRVHHGQNDYCIDRNYGGILILFDRMFGTYADERADERIIYGVRTPLRSLNPAWANLHYYADLWLASRSVRGWRGKLHVWFGPPGGWTGEPLGHFDATLFTHYRPATPPAAALYAMLQFALLVPCVSHLIAIAPSLAQPQLLLYAGVVVASTLTLGALLEDRRWALRAEQARALGLGLAFALLPQWFGYAAPMVLKLTILVVMVIAVVWLDKNIKTFQWRTT